jgi:hypothetical protein
MPARLIVAFVSGYERAHLETFAHKFVLLGFLARFKRPRRVGRDG